MLPREVVDFLGRLRRRWRWRGVVVWFGRFLPLACGFVLAAVVADDLLAAEGRVLTGGLFSAAAILLGSALVFLLRSRPDDLFLARLADFRLGLADALSSAVSFAELGLSDAFARLTVLRSGGIAAGLDHRRVLALSMPWRGMVLAGLLLALGWIWWGVRPAYKWRVERAGGLVRPPVPLLRGSGRTLERLAHRAEREGETRIAETLRAAGRVASLLVSTPAPLEPILTRLDRLEEQLSGAEGGGVCPGRLLDVLHTAGRALRDSELTSEVGRRLQRPDLAGAQRALRRLAGRLAEGGMEGGGRQATRSASRALARAAEVLSNLAPDLARRLAEAADELDRSRPRRAARSLRLAGIELGRLDGRLRRGWLVRRAKEELGRLRALVRAGAPPKGEGYWAMLLEEVPESLRRQPLPTVDALVVSPGPGGVGTADTGAGADGAPTRLRVERRLVRVRGRMGPVGPILARIVRGAGAGGTSSVAYRRVFAEYAAQVEAALERDEVPLGYRCYVRRYFTRIRPSR